MNAARRIYMRASAPPPISYFVIRSFGFDSAFWFGHSGFPA